MLGFDTTMKGRFRSACMRWANLAGKSDRVKLAEESRASAESGGRPCLQARIRNDSELRRISFVSIILYQIGQCQ